MKADSTNTNGTTLVLEESSEDSIEYLVATQARDETIRIRAYGIYLDRGGRDGSDVEDWLKAEIECFGKQTL